MFIETITSTGNSFLIPIDRIKFVNMEADPDRIVITSDDGEWTEYFEDCKTVDLILNRYNEIKDILDGSI
jgi:hypothetical protein